MDTNMDMVMDLDLDLDQEPVKRTIRTINGTASGRAGVIFGRGRASSKRVNPSEEV